MDSSAWLERPETVAALSPEEIRDRLTATSNPISIELIVALQERTASLQTSNPTLAREIADHMVRRAPSDPGQNATRARATAHRARAEASIFCGRLRDADRDYGRAASEAESADAHQLLGQILVGWVGVMAALGRGDEVHGAARRAERLLQRSGDRAYLAKLHMNLGNTAYHEERYEDAFLWYRRALAQMETLGQENSTWVALMVNQAVACRNTGRLHEARVLFRRAALRAEALGLDRYRAQILLNRSNLERDTGDYRAAMGLIQAAEELLRSLDLVDVAAGARLNQTEMLLELGMPADAAELARETAEQFDTLDMRIDAALCRFLGARAALALEEIDIALALAEMAERELRRQRAWPRLASLRLLRARALRIGGESGRALSVARSALRTFEGRRMSQGIAATRALIIDCHLGAGRIALAENEVRNMTPHVARLNPGERASWLRTAASVAKAAGKPADARARLRRAVSALEEQRRLIPGLELRAAAFREQVRVYHDLVSLLVDGRRPRFEEVLTLVEAARGRTFRDRQRIPPEAGAALAGDRARLGALVRRLDELEHDPSIAATDTDLRRVRDEVRAVEKTISQRLLRIDPGAGDDLPSAPLDGIRGRLSPSDALVEYFITDGRILALVLTRDLAEVVTLSTPLEDVEGPLFGLLHLVETMSATATRTFGNLPFLRHVADQGLGELYEQLVEPLEPLLRGCDRLVMIPHGPLHQVPFECLHTPEGYLAERRTVVRIPTATSLLDRDPSTFPVGAGRALVSGTVKGGPEMVAAELEAVADRLGRDRTELLIDPRSEDLLNRLSEADVVHLAAHGVFRSDNPAFSHLTTADGGLFVADLLGSRFRADLVVLSACNTGRVFTGQGDDLSGVAHAFLAAGARQLVASLWRVHDGATLALMRAFYDALDPDLGNVASALSQAAAEVRKEWDHPFFWGGFCVHGV